MSVPDGGVEPLIAELGLTKAEEAVVRVARTHHEPDANQAQVLTLFYVQRRIRDAVELLVKSGEAQAVRIVQSNEGLAKANSRYARALNWLTGVLAGATVVLAAATVALVLVQILLRG